MKKKTILAAVLALFAATGTVRAESPKAEEYRKMFSSGNFYLKYEDDYGDHAVGEKDGTRMVRKVFTKSVLATILNPLGALFGPGPDKRPEVMYLDGKFYQLKYNLANKKDMIMLNESQLDDENLDPSEGWSNIKNTLSLPSEIAVLAWDDRFRPKTAAVQRPVFTGSGKKSDKNKEYACDTYTSKIVNRAGGAVGEAVYRLMYDDAGNLFKIEAVTVRDGKEYRTNTLKIKKLEPSLPDGVFHIKKNTKVFAAGVGDMDDLLRKSVQVETLNESKGDASKEDDTE